MLDFYKNGTKALSISAPTLSTAFVVDTFLIGAYLPGIGSNQTIDSGIEFYNFALLETDVEVAMEKSFTYGYNPLL